MGRILLLPEAVASQVAAGEVVERPSSVVKELVENSLDAGARQIEVAIRRGGTAMIRVADDGAGMDRDDALLCLERHATSKLRTGRDLAAVATLGFRGEAVPSIASVSRFRLLTREPAALAGTEVLVHGGKIEAVREAGAAPGTVVEARTLFYNLPARRKFLRAEATEAAHVERQLQLLAVGHPRVGFTFRRDERLVFQLPPAADLLERIRDLLGPAVVNELLPTAPASGGPSQISNFKSQIPGGIRTVSGFIGRAGVSRATRADQIVFVNGRAVENVALSQGLREGYHTALMKGRHPLTFLFVEMDPATVDVNVHPAKREVRFREPGAVREVLAGVVRRTLAGARAEWGRSFHQPPLPTTGDHASPTPERTPATARQPDFDEEHPAVFVQALPNAVRPTLDPAVVQVVDDRLSPPGEPPSNPTPSVSLTTALPERTPAPPPPLTAHHSPPTTNPFHILGVLGRLYVLMENDQGLVLVDQHAAHERVLFEELRRRLDAGGVPGQRLLPAVPVDLGPREADWLRTHAGALGRMGIGVESFGPGGSFLLDTLPPFLSGGEPEALLREIIDAGRAAGAPPTVETPGARLRLAEELIAKTVCRHAVKAHDRLRGPELERLLADLLACELPYCCPHGRPTMIQLSYAELEKKFGRRT